MGRTGRRRWTTRSRSSSSTATFDTAGGLGQYAIGTFTADSSKSQTLSFAPSTVQGTLCGAAFQLDGLELRQVPEPSALILLASGLLGLLCYAWRRRR